MTVLIHSSLGPEMTLTSPLNNKLGLLELSRAVRPPERKLMPIYTTNPNKIYRRDLFCFNTAYSLRLQRLLGTPKTCRALIVMEYMYPGCMSNSRKLRRFLPVKSSNLEQSRSQEGGNGGGGSCPVFSLLVSPLDLFLSVSLFFSLSLSLSLSLSFFFSSLSNTNPVSIINTSW